jgi:hypothetical protein
MEGGIKKAKIYTLLSTIGVNITDTESEVGEHLNIQLF